MKKLFLTSAIALSTLFASAQNFIVVTTYDGDQEETTDKITQNLGFGYALNDTWTVGLIKNGVDAEGDDNYDLWGRYNWNANTYVSLQAPTEETTDNLTVGVGFADGTKVGTGSATAVETDSSGYAITGASVVKAGAKYVSGDITFAVGVTAGEGNDGDQAAAVSGSDDSYDATSASISYAVASGVTAILGYTDVDSSDEGVNDTTDGSAWYIGANMAF